MLWRHAEAFDAREGQSDLDRPLSPKGERQAQRMAEWIHRQLPATARVLVSPALRTQQTAEALDRRFKTVPVLAPGATVDTLLHAVRWPDAKETVLVIGHQPTLGQAAAYLLAGQTEAWPVRKGALWWLRSREREGVRQVVLHAMMAPDLV